MTKFDPQIRKKGRGFLCLCPLCKSSDHIGFLGGNINKKFFCSECSVEFIVKENYVTKIYMLLASGMIQEIKR